MGFAVRTTKTQHGFTLVEMLVVIAIIAILAVALMPQLTKAREQGYSSRCKVNLRNLAQGALNFSVDQSGALPFAGGYEVEDRIGWFHERQGWVTWIPRAGATPSWPNEDPQSADMEQPIWYGPKATTAITNGTLWEFVSQDARSYICPKFKKKTICGQNDARRSYTMNRFFGFRDNARWYHQTMINLGRDSSRLLLFSEMCPQRNYFGRPVNTQISVVSARDTSDVNAGDSVMDPIGSGSGTTDVKPYESIGYMHPMNGEYYGHVVFVDGHVEAFTLIKTGSVISTNITARLCSGDY
jgi:prepilin-type N-terminal cleavage/methylation domain-containing protein/prepilin-type processing-associated H-X9-DG protein